MQLRYYCPMIGMNTADQEGLVLFDGLTDIALQHLWHWDFTCPLLGSLGGRHFLDWHRGNSPTSMLWFCREDMVEQPVNTSHASAGFMKPSDPGNIRKGSEGLANLGIGWLRHLSFMIGKEFKSVPGLVKYRFCPATLNNFLPSEFQNIQGSNLIAFLDQALHSGLIW